MSWLGNILRIGGLAYRAVDALDDWAVKQQVKRERKAVEDRVIARARAARERVRRQRDKK